MKNRKLLVACIGMLLSTFLWAKDPYKYTLDLTKVVDDKVYVELAVPNISEKEIIFYMPKIVPGTYAVADYGRMVSDLKAFDKKGREIEVERLDDNSWKITKAKKLDKLSYWVEDTFDTEKEGPGIFQPAGTNIEDDKNFIINTSGFFGYFEGMKKEKFQFDIIRDKDFYGATGLIQDNNAPLNANLGEGLNGQSEVATDRFVVEDYDRLIDSPLMYAEADTAIIKVANTDVLVASYSPNKMITAAEIAESIREVLAAQNEFLGGELPVDKYAFIFYFTDQPVSSYGALEHSYSSVYYMPEATIGQMNQQLRDFAAHEFFHIVTPLNIHSEEIGSFDFNDPKMSRHLWLYEGMTEYFAGSVQVKYGLVTPEEYLGMLGQKIIVANNFKDELPFTELSLGALDEHANQYYNVYQKGALIGAALDIKLRELSNGEYGVQNMMKDLAQKYGKDASFKDENLFNEIVELTYPEIKEFFETYVSGTTPLDYTEVFGKVGVLLNENGTTKQWSIGINQNVVAVRQYEEKQRIAIGNEDGLDDIGKGLGLKNGDIIMKMNGADVPALDGDINAFMTEQFSKLPSLETFTMTVAREIDGEFQSVELSTENRQVDIPLPLGLVFDPNASQEQLQLRKYWLEPAE